MKKAMPTNPPNLQESDLNKYGRWIPGEIYYNPMMSWLDSALFGLVLSLCNNEKGVCTASNAYLARDLQVEPDTIQKALKKLEGEGYIIRTGPIRDNKGMVVERPIEIDPNYKALYREMLIRQIEQRGLKR